MVSLIFTTDGFIKYDTKTMQISKKITFMFKNEIEAEGLSDPKSTGISTVIKCISRPNLVILAWIGGNLSCSQAQNWVNFDFKLNLTLKVTVDQPGKQQES